MRATVILLRRKGRRVKSDADLESLTFEGNVHSAGIVIQDVRHHYVSMRAGLPADATRPLPPDLYEPTLTGIGQDAVILRGFERVGDVGYVQEWRIHPKPY